MMDMLQTIFYVVSIIFMTVGLVLLIIIGIVLITIKRNLTHLYEVIDEKIEKLGRFASDPADAAIEIGTKVASRAVRKVKEALSS